MSNTLPEELKYTKTHEWALQESKDIIMIGITDHAQQLLGDMVFVELPEVGDTVHAGDELGVVESVKAASDFYAPITGEIIEINEELANAPALVNTDPYGDGWLVKIRIEDPEEYDELMSAEDYEETLTEDEE
jgi:glycine cleavage system H protein